MSDTAKTFPKDRRRGAILNALADTLQLAVANQTRHRMRAAVCCGKMVSCHLTPVAAWPDYSVPIAVGSRHAGDRKIEMKGTLCRSEICAGWSPVLWAAAIIFCSSRHQYSHDAVLQRAGERWKRDRADHRYAGSCRRGSCMWRSPPCCTLRSKVNGWRRRRPRSLRSTGWRASAQASSRAS